MRSGEPRLFDHFDWPFFGVLAAILSLSVLNLYSATSRMDAPYFKLQLTWMMIGSLVILVLLFFDYRGLERLAYPVYFVVLLLLLLVLFKGRSALGAQRWIQLGPLSIQPSELIKPAMVLVLARFFTSRRSLEALDLRALLVPCLITAIPVGLILKQPDLGTAIVVAATAGTMIAFVGVQRRILLTAFFLCVVAVPLMWNFGLHGYQKDRVHSFLNPEKYAKGKGYQTIQSRIAIGAGQLGGRGYLQGSQTKLKFLPKQHTDFIFSNFAEEFGFVGSIGLMVLYGSLILLGLKIGQTAKDPFGMILALGMTSLLGAQVWINLAMELGLLPVVGVPLPLFSYGGTSLLSTLLAIGILLNISMRRYLF